jgi:uncharacterized protein
LPFNILLSFSNYYSTTFWQITYLAVYALGVIPLACSYATFIAMAHNSGREWVRLFEPVGRMALSNYILQSILSVFIFSGLGLGQAYKLPIWACLVVVLIVFSIQILQSSLWLKRYRFGPIEWLWRMMTYGEIIPLRKQNE